ncbi:MAG: FKBP-type peptidyl-prolyl cis-trans isomerase [Phycisphaerales bacterium]|nr:MAG: FKBP-type peptidyl-prolyl cis-trans isomerase [Phycisphaerales bacterium]
MTSSVHLAAGRLVTTDRGLAADGSIAWGQDDDASYTFERAEPNVRAELLSGGLVVIDFARPEGEIEASNGTDVTVEYKGWVQDLNAPVATGVQFASSERDGQPFTFPLPGRLIDGWNAGIPGATVGTIRRMVIPPELGYGERGAAGGQIPPNATLFFEVRVLDITSVVAE